MPVGTRAAGAPPGLGEREAERRLAAAGRNRLERRGGPRWPRELLAQFTHPLALLLAAAAVLAFAAGITVLALAIVGVIVLNAGLAFFQERQAEHAIEALRAYLPPQARVRRDGREREIDAEELVPGDVVLLAEGDRISADARLLSGSLEIDMSALTGESAPVVRDAAATPAPAERPLERENLVFSGTGITGGEAEGVVTATGMHTEIGRLAALSQRVGVDESPLQREVRRVAWIIAAIAVGVGVAFVPIGTLAAGLPLGDAVVFAIGLLVANVPEGLLPTITLALAAGVRQLARGRALVKRLSGVDTLGSTDVICTDKTGTLTVNRMEALGTWTPAEPELATALAHCSGAALDADGTGHGDPTEVALLRVAAGLGADVGVAARERDRRLVFAFDPSRRLMTTVDEADGLVAHVKGAPDVLLERCTAVLGPDGAPRPLDDAERARIAARIDGYAADGLRVMGVARRALDRVPEPDARDATERELSLVGLVALRDPPRPEVPAAVARCHTAGIRILVVTGDHGLTARHIAREVGIDVQQVLTGDEVEAMTEPELDDVLRRPGEIVFARSSPEDKLRIAHALQDLGHVVAMTGDGVNDAPALRRADIGVAMGRSGTDVAREAATMVLTDDNFATIVEAVAEGRRVYANIRKFILYIFAHAPAEVVPFLCFALSGGRIPLPLTAVQILAIDLGTETLPALALGRERPEAGLMERPPRSRAAGVIDRALLGRAWALLGLVSSVLVVAGFGWVLVRAGWSPGDAVDRGSGLHDDYLRATTMTFAGIVSCQLGTAFAARTDRDSLRSLGVWSNPLLLYGIAFEIAVAAAVIYLPAFQHVFGTRALGPAELLFLAPFGPIVWGVDEARRARLRRRAGFYGSQARRRADAHAGGGI